MLPGGILEGAVRVSLGEGRCPCAGGAEGRREMGDGRRVGVVDWGMRGFSR